MKRKSVWIKTIILLLAILIILDFSSQIFVSAANTKPIQCHSNYREVKLSYLEKVALLTKIKTSISFKKTDELIKSRGERIDWMHPLLKSANVNNRVIYLVELPVKSTNLSEMDFVGFATTKGFSSIKPYVFSGKYGSGNMSQLSVFDVTKNRRTVLFYNESSLIKVNNNGTVFNCGSNNEQSNGGWCAACIACEVGCEAGCDYLSGGILFFECIGACYMACRYPCEKCGW